MGFSPYGQGHISALVCAAALTVLLLLWLRTRSVAIQNRTLKLLAVAMLVLELGKDFVLGWMGTFSLGYLPLHLCSISMLLCLYVAFHPQSKTAGQILFSVALPGALSALLFPDWIRLPLLHFQSVHSFLYHTLLVTFSLSPTVLGRCRPGITGVIPSMVFLIGTAIPVGILNRLLHTNYMFLRGPSPGSPLEFLAGIPGAYSYWVAYFLLVLMVVLLLNLPFSLLPHLKKSP